jgi:ubiquinone biosynthesis protein UbiJ
VTPLIKEHKHLSDKSFFKADILDDYLVAASTQREVGKVERSVGEKVAPSFGDVIIMESVKYGIDGVVNRITKGHSVMYTIIAHTLTEEEFSKPRSFPIGDNG